MSNSHSQFEVEFNSRFESDEIEVKQIECGVCQLAMKNARDLMNEKDVFDVKSEEADQDFVETICRLAKRGGHGLRRVEIQNAGDHLKVENMRDLGECRQK